MKQLTAGTFLHFTIVLNLLISIVLETESATIAQRVSKKGVEATEGTPFTEQSLSQAWANAKQTLARSLLS